MIKFTNNITGQEHTATFHSSVKTLPIKQYQLVQKYSLIDLGVGSSLHDVNRHLSRIDQFLSAKEIEAAILERQNLQINFSFMLDKQVVPLYITCAMLDKFDGQKVVLDDEDELDNYYEIFSNSTVTFGVISEIAETQKKSLLTN